LRKLVNDGSGHSESTNPGVQNAYRRVYHGSSVEGSCAINGAAALESWIAIKNSPNNVVQNLPNLGQMCKIDLMP
jgi:hypothetical protein